MPGRSSRTRCRLHPGTHIYISNATKNLLVVLGFFQVIKFFSLEVEKIEFLKFFFPFTTFAYQILYSTHRLFRIKITPRKWSESVFLRLAVKIESRGKSKKSKFYILHDMYILSGELIFSCSGGTSSHLNIQRSLNLRLLRSPSDI